MDALLSLVLPLHNAQHSLTDRVHHLLEVLADLTDRFEIVLVDDGSSDDTSEVAYELTVRYPQLQMVRHSRRRGESAAVKSGLARAGGEVVLVHEENAPVSARQIRRLWSLRSQPPKAQEAASSGSAHPETAGSEPQLTRPHLLRRRGGPEPAFRRHRTLKR